MKTPSLLSCWPSVAFMCAAMYMATTYSRKLKVENDCGNHADRFGLYHTQHIGSSKTTAGHVRRKFSCLFDSWRRAWMQGDWKAMVLSPHSRQIEDFLLDRKLVAQMRDIIVNRTEQNLPVWSIKMVISNIVPWIKLIKILCSNN